jgi:hypothetical protein
MLAEMLANSVFFAFITLIINMERAMGIEPTYQAWEARVLPLNYARRVCRKESWRWRLSCQCFC